MAGNTGALRVAETMTKAEPAMTSFTIRSNPMSNENVIYKALVGLGLASQF